MREQVRGARFRGVISLMTVIGLVFVLTVQITAQQPVVEKLVLDETIQPVSAGMLDRAIARANTSGAAALLIEMNTPGGLVDSMRTMAGAILSSRVPVIVYVAPAGARAGSAGFFLLEAADIAAMAPGTNAGAAHVVFEGGKPDETLSQKVENDAEAFLRSYVSRRNRNTEAAIAAVASSHSYSAEEALNQHLIDVIAGSDKELLDAVDGREITHMDGAKQTLHTKNARIDFLQPTLRENLLGWLVNPNIALLLLVGGALLIYLEFNTPGTIVPGALGTLMVLLGIFALDLLPIRFTAVMLLLAALGLILLEAKFGGHGVLGVAGIVCLTFGTLTLISAPIPELRINPWVAVGVSLGFGAITVLLVRIAMKARKLKARLGVDALVGSEASAMEPLAPEGHVLVEGEIWRAVCSEAVEKGTKLRITGHELQAIEYRMPIASAQVKTAILFATLFARGTTSVEEPVRTRDHGELALQAFGAALARGGNRVSMAGGQKLHAIEASIPGDISSAAFFLCAAALFPDSNLVLDSVLMNPTRAALLDVLIAMGCRISVLQLEEHHGELVGTVTVQGSQLKGTTISGALSAALIDELPVLAAIGPYTTSGIEIRDARELRVKESDRIAAVAANLRAMGATVEERDDGLRVPGNQPLHGTEVDSGGDHRIAMAFAVAALRASSDTLIHNAGAAQISYPEFFSTLEALVER